MSLKLWYVETGCGVGLQLASNAESARSKALQEVGTMNGVNSVKEATTEDIAWVRTMGGYVPIINTMKDNL